MESTCNWSEEVETTKHLLWKCPVARTCWLRVDLAGVLEEFEHLQGIEWLYACRNWNDLKSQLSNLWQLPGYYGRQEIR